MKLSLGVGKIVSIVKVTTDKNAKIANSSVTSYTIAGVEVGSVANQLRFILANFTSNRKVLQCHTISTNREIFENQPNPGYCKSWGLERVIFVATRERQLRYLLQTMQSNRSCWRDYRCIRFATQRLSLQLFGQLWQVYRLRATVRLISYRVLDLPKPRARVASPPKS